MTDEIELYSIDSFYVGILNISCKMGNLLIPHNTNFSDLSKRKFELLNNGALYKEYFNNWNRRLAYDSIYTLFLKKIINIYAFITVKFIQKMVMTIVAIFKNLKILFPK